MHRSRPGWTSSQVDRRISHAWVGEHVDHSGQATGKARSSAGRSSRAPTLLAVAAQCAHHCRSGSRAQSGHHRSRTTLPSRFSKPQMLLLPITDTTATLCRTSVSHSMPLNPNAPSPCKSYRPGAVPRRLARQGVKPTRPQAAKRTAVQPTAWQIAVDHPPAYDPKSPASITTRSIPPSSAASSAWPPSIDAMIWSSTSSVSRSRAMVSPNASFLDPALVVGATRSSAESGGGQIPIVRRVTGRMFAGSTRSATMSCVVDPNTPTEAQTEIHRHTGTISATSASPAL